MPDKAVKQLDWNTPQKVHYCIPLPIRDLQIKANIKRVTGRILPATPERIEELKSQPIAVVCYGPSLADTWEEIRGFKYVMTCSGAHKFMVGRGIIPTYHVEVDPRPHKVTLMGTPQQETEYLIASACSPKLFDHLEGYNVKLWHVFDNLSDGARFLPREEWALTGGCGAGLRAVLIARFIGFTDIHIFGMDGSEGATGKHAAEHPNQSPGYSEVEYGGKKYRTTPAFLEAARTTPYELDQLPDVTATFHGDGLCQAIMRDHKRKPAKKQSAIGAAFPQLISPGFRELNRKLHEERVDYGAWGSRHAPIVLRLVEGLRAKGVKLDSVLDYGCGKGLLAAELPFPIWEYDPAIPGKDELPRPADLVICADVLEHVEPEKLGAVLEDLRRCIKQVGYLVIHTGPSNKTYADGRNTHMTQQGADWWKKVLSQYFEIGQLVIKDSVTYNIMVGPRKNDAMVAMQDPNRRRWHVIEDWVKNEGYKNGAEVGVKDGRTFLHLLANCPELSLTGVDLFEPRRGLEAEGGESHSKSHLQECERMLRKVVKKKYPERGKLIKGMSVDVAKTIPDSSLDFVFIDADHRYESVKADIEAWRPKIRPGGRLSGHDAQDKFPGVIAAINELCPGWVLASDSVWKYQIPNSK